MKFNYPVYVYKQIIRLRINGMLILSSLFLRTICNSSYLRLSFLSTSMPLSTSLIIRW